MPDTYKQIGKVLLATRKEQKKELAEVAEASKIMVKYLEAIENGDPSQLPSATYFLLFARSYASIVGLDPAIIDEMADHDPTGLPSNGKEIEPDTEEEVDEEEGPKEEKGSGNTLLTIAVVILLIVAALVVYKLYFVDPTSAINGDAANVPAGAEVGEIPGMNQAGVEPTAYLAAEPLKFHMLANQDVWAMVIRDGDTVLNRELKGGEQRSWEAKYRYFVTLGISTAVKLTLNGEALAPLTERPRTVLNVEINQTNFEKFLLKNNPNSAAVLPPVEPRRTSPQTQPAASPPATPSSADSSNGETGNGN